jgi:hypothetical protein
MILSNYKVESERDAQLRLLGYPKNGVSTYTEISHLMNKTQITHPMQFVNDLSNDIRNKLIETKNKPTNNLKKK